MGYSQPSTQAIEVIIVDGAGVVIGSMEIHSTEDSEIHLGPGLADVTTSDEPEGTFVYMTVPKGD